ncbi:cell division protein ZapA [Alicyclobacillus sacchari]|uniref:Cell division protein ZapA n=1 Tax=Alicyclobacillus sacchari TaxID=392010 RepID=A0A4R8LWB0_9BACL|nr:cell division protein ZapA [Alicyclobacillus sacchari]TDY51077.1 cell division protein ZapA [Alicyclobacillus sacchari]
MDNKSVNRVKVVIHGIEYTLRGTTSEQHIQEVARMVDRCMAEIAATASYMDERRVAVLAALNLAEQLHQLQREYRELLNLLEEQTGGTSQS